jgi:LysR family transcriptional regulator, benzoate and cis,cis-muconate-responsive activator of ben and cat genes
LTKKLPDIDQIGAFLAVAEELSFRRAAERLAVDQSALSRRVKDLEARIGFQLLVRTTHTVRLTDAGRSFYDANHRIVERLGDAIVDAARIAHGSKGSLRIAYMTFAAVDILPVAVGKYSKAFPDVSIVLSYQRTQLQKLSLARGEIDLGLMLGPFEHSDFHTLEVARERLVAMMAADHPLAARSACTVTEVAAQTLVIGTHDQWDFYREMIEEVLGAQGFRPTIGFEAPSFIGIQGLVRAGLGITLVPEVMLDFCPTGLVARRIIDAEHPISTLAVWRQPAEGKVRDFLTILRRTHRDSGAKPQE